jgi:hypothetical protein
MKIYESLSLLGIAKALTGGLHIVITATPSFPTSKSTLTDAMSKRQKQIKSWFLYESRKNFFGSKEKKTMWVYSFIERMNGKCTKKLQRNDVIM